MILIKKCKLYMPEFKGIRDVLIGGEKILRVKENIELDASLGVETIDGEGLICAPGFIDSHVHILGGGGEGGFKYRTPELKLTDFTANGVTTAVGCLGTDGIGRTMTDLLAKASGLNEEGISCYVYTGSYQIPVVTLTDSITKDIMMIEKVIGVGELAISDHRSSHASREALYSTFSQARVGGVLSGKAGIINVHLGDGKEALMPIYDTLNHTEIPITQFLPTHLNRNQQLYHEAITKYAKLGGYIDFTTSTTEKFIEDGEVAAPLALAKALENRVSIGQITFSSDGGGSLPNFDAKGELKGLSVGKSKSLFEAVVKAVTEHGVSLEDGLRVITENPAKILKLENKGRVEIGYDGDLVLFNEMDYQIHSVIAKGKIHVRNNCVLIKDTFE